MILSLVCVLLALIAIGVPIAFALGATTAVGFLAWDLTSLTQIPHSQFSNLNSFTLLAIPLFILAGSIMVKARMAEDLVAFTYQLSRPIRGGAALGGGIGAALFGSMTGSSAAAAAALGKVTVPELEKFGYPKRFSSGLMAAGGTLGIMIPPSVIFVLYAVIARESVTEVFLAGVVPGILLAFLIATTGIVVARRNGYGDAAEFDFKKLFLLGRKAAAALLMPVIVLGGIYSGLFTPTEAAAVSVAYGLFIGGFVYRTLRVGDLVPLFLSSARTTAVVLFILAGSVGIGTLTALTGLEETIIRTVDAAGIEPWQFLLILNGIFLLLGLFLDGYTLIIVFVPILLPVATALGIDPLHFAVVLAANIEIAAITPPIGFNLYVMSSAARTGIGEVLKGVFPFAGALLFGLLLLTYIPLLSTWLPSFL